MSAPVILDCPFCGGRHEVTQLLGVVPVIRCPACPPGVFFGVNSQYIQVESP